MEDHYDAAFSIHTIIFDAASDGYFRHICSSNRSATTTADAVARPANAGNDADHERFDGAHPDDEPRDEPAHAAGPE